MQSIEEAIRVLKSKFGKVKPICYWKKQGYYVIETEWDGSTGCNYYIVDGNDIRYTNPALERLRITEAIQIK